eukprot:118941-Rhodomonas_salina.1
MAADAKRCTMASSKRRRCRTLPRSSSTSARSGSGDVLAARWRKRRKKVWRPYWALASGRAAMTARITLSI